MLPRHLMPSSLARQKRLARIQEYKDNLQASGEVAQARQGAKVLNDKAKQYEEKARQATNSVAELRADVRQAESDVLQAGLAADTTARTTAANDAPKKYPATFSPSSIEEQQAAEQERKAAANKAAERKAAQEARKAATTAAVKSLDAMKAGDPPMDAIAYLSDADKDVQSSATDVRPKTDRSACRPRPYKVAGAAKMLRPAAEPRRPWARSARTPGRGFRHQGLDVQ